MMMMMMMTMMVVVVMVMLIEREKVDHGGLFIATQLTGPFVFLIHPSLVSRAGTHTRGRL
jgi:hypothetical protein